MRTSSTLLGAAVGLAVWTSSARAQQAVAIPSAPPVVQGQEIVIGPVGSVVSNGAVIGSPVYPLAPVAGSAPIVNSGRQVHAYSYYVSFPAPSRTYVEYGAADQFPYRGQPYGHPGDRWSWSAMSNNGGGTLAKYYYQILP